MCTTIHSKVAKTCFCYWWLTRAPCLFDSDWSTISASPVLTLHILTLVRAELRCKKALQFAVYNLYRSAVILAKPLGAVIFSGWIHLGAMLPAVLWDAGGRRGARLTQRGLVRASQPQRQLHIETAFSLWFIWMWNLMSLDTKTQYSFFYRSV